MWPLYICIHFSLALYMFLAFLLSNNVCRDAVKWKIFWTDELEQYTGECVPQKYWVCTLYQWNVRACTIDELMFTLSIKREKYTSELELCMGKCMYWKHRVVFTTQLNVSYRCTASIHCKQSKVYGTHEFLLSFSLGSLMTPGLSKEICSYDYTLLYFCKSPNQTSSPT